MNKDEYELKNTVTFCTRCGLSFPTELRTVTTNDLAGNRTIIRNQPQCRACRGRYGDKS